VQCTAAQQLARCTKPRQSVHAIHKPHRSAATHATRIAAAPITVRRNRCNGTMCCFVAAHHPSGRQQG
jgi:hypothetical protein